MEPTLLRRLVKAKDGRSYLVTFRKEGDKVRMIDCFPVNAIEHGNGMAGKSRFLRMVNDEDPPQ